MTRVPVVDPERLEAHGQLLSFIADLAESGRPAPCITSQYLDFWTSDDPAEQDHAAKLCTGCSALRLCRSYVDQYPEPAAVYGGLTASERKNQK